MTSHDGTRSIKCTPVTSWETGEGAKVENKALKSRGLGDGMTLTSSGPTVRHRAGGMALVLTPTKGQVHFYNREEFVQGVRTDTEAEGPVRKGGSRVQSVWNCDNHGGR